MSDRPPLFHRYARRLAVDGVALAKLDGALFDARLDLPIARIAVSGETVQHLDDHAADLLEFGDAEAARGASRRAQANTGSDRRLLGIERHAVLVAGDVGTPERDLRSLAGQLLGSQIDQHHMG